MAFVTCIPSHLEGTDNVQWEVSQGSCTPYRTITLSTTIRGWSVEVLLENLQARAAQIDKLVGEKNSSRVVVKLSTDVLIPCTMLISSVQSELMGAITKICFQYIGGLDYIRITTMDSHASEGLGNMLLPRSVCRSTSSKPKRSWATDLLGNASAYWRSANSRR